LPSSPPPSPSPYSAASISPSSSRGLYRVALGNENRELPKPGAIFVVGPLIASLLIVITTAILLRALTIVASIILTLWQ
jgi:hypothetical protein